MGRRTLIIVASLLLAAACQTAAASRTGDAQLGLAAPAPAPVRVPVLATPPTTAPPLPVPSPLREDPYGPEEVVELGVMEIPKLGLVHDMFQGVTMHNIDLGPSHWPGTALPGELGNTVIAGHRVSHSAPFRRLDRLEPGDEVVFTLGAVRSVYRVTSTMIVEPTDTWIGDQTADFTGTLYSCHPPGSAAFRIVVKLALDRSA